MFTGKMICFSLSYEGDFDYADPAEFGDASKDEQPRRLSSDLLQTRSRSMTQGRITPMYQPTTVVRAS